MAGPAASTAEESRKERKTVFQNHDEYISKTPGKNFLHSFLLS